MIRREDYPDASAYLHAVITARRRRIRRTILLVVLCIAGILLFLYEYFKVRTVIVQGNTRYTNEQISDIVMTGPLGNNSLYLSILYADKDVPDVPFVERMNVSVLRHDTIRITVYEMALAGYVDYLGRYMYFSRDGTVVESSTQALSDVPQVLGLSFDHIALYEKLPVEDPSVFQQILEITQISDKYDVSVDKIYFDSSGNMSLYFGNVRADIGTGDYLDDKLSNISRILPGLEGRTGVLKMTQYTPGTRYITFVIQEGTAGTSTGTDETPKEADSQADTADTSLPASEENNVADLAQAGSSGTSAADQGEVTLQIPVEEETATANTSGSDTQESNIESNHSDSDSPDQADNSTAGAAGTNGQTGGGQQGNVAGSLVEPIPENDQGVVVSQ